MDYGGRQLNRVAYVRNISVLQNKFRLRVVRPEAVPLQAEQVLGTLSKGCSPSVTPRGNALLF